MKNLFLLGLASVALFSCEQNTTRPAERRDVNVTVTPVGATGLSGASGVNVRVNGLSGITGLQINRPLTPARFEQTRIDTNLEQR